MTDGTALEREIAWMRAQQEELFSEFKQLRENHAALSGEHAALERAYAALESENEALKARCEELRETLVRERREHAKGDSLRYLEFQITPVKGQDMALVVKCKPGAERVVIPETFEGQPVIGVEERAFADHPTLTEVDVPYGVRAIGDFAFENCPNLALVHLPKSVVWMGENSFRGSANAAFACQENSYAHWFAQHHGHEVRPFDPLVDVK